jgi:hypothetical protein
MGTVKNETPESEYQDSAIETQTTSNSQSPLTDTNEANPIIPRPRKFILTKYTIYVTTQRMYIVGSNTRETVFRILEIDLVNTDKLTVMEDNVYFTRNEIMEVLNGIEDSSEGGLTKKLTAVGLLGFIKFTKNYYLLVVTKRKEVAVLGSHEIYHIDETELIPVTNSNKILEKKSIEARYVQTFLNIDLNKTFYYSYSYDLTNSLQTNILRNKRQSLNLNGNTELSYIFQFNERFMWNCALLEPIFQTFDKVYDWFQPIIHGFIDQVKNTVFQIQFYITLIARRSHRFAGARFFKRGVNDDGDVANEVETEQIVCDMLTSSFHDPAAGFYNNPRYTSFVQHRGSIPLSWSQETAPNLRITKPPIDINALDPFYSKAALHFNNLFERYGTPIQVLNLIKQREKIPRESKLLDAFNECIEYLNQFLPNDKKLDYTAWDMSRAAKSRSQDVIKWLENYSEDTLAKTGFFHNGKTIFETKLQQGLCRTNCVDCLDRTNTAQFVIGKRALGYQLHSLGIIKERYLEYDSDVTNVLTEMFHDHGDTIALQYGGSHLVNTLQTYRKINQWSSHSRDIIESVKRFYSNSFIDAQRQEAINLFLGNYVYSPDKPMLWELNTDYYLHNRKNTSEINGTNSYTHWYNDSNLIDKKKSLTELWESSISNKFSLELQERGLLIVKIDPYIGCFENYWNIKYGSRNLVSLNELFEFNMNSTRRYSTHTDQKSIINYNINKPSNLDQGSSSPSFGLFSLFKNRDELIVPETNKNRRFNSFSERLRGTSPKLTFDPENEEDNYFSPFKSRKPHRELKMIYSSDSDENAIIEDEKDHEEKLSQDFAKLMQCNIEDETEYLKYREQYKLLMFSLLQLRQLSKETDLIDDKFIENANILDKIKKTKDSALPVIAYSNLKEIIKSEKDKGEGIDENEILDTPDDQIAESSGSSFEDSILTLEDEMRESGYLSDLAECHGIVLPDVKEDTINFYKNSIDMSHGIPVLGLSEYVTEQDTGSNNTNNIYAESIESYDSSLEERKSLHGKSLNNLMNEYKQLGNPFIDSGDLDKYIKQTRIMNQETADYNDGIDIPNIKIFDNYKENNNEIPEKINKYNPNVLSPIDNDNTDSEHYFSFRLLGKKPSKANLGGLKNSNEMD